MGNQPSKKEHMDVSIGYNVPSSSQRSIVQAQFVSDIINPEGVRDRSARDQISKANYTRLDAQIDQQNRPVPFYFFDPGNVQRIMSFAESQKIYNEVVVKKAMSAVYGLYEHRINGVDSVNKIDVMNAVQFLNAETFTHLKNQKNVFVPKPPRIKSHLPSVYNNPDQSDNNKEMRRDYR